jgi:hypothetical protein
MPDLAEIIQRLHDSEINGSVDWFFDGVWNWRIGDQWGGWRHEGKAASFEEAVRDLAERAFSERPRSRFAAWWARQR